VKQFHFFSGCEESILCRSTMCNLDYTLPSPFLMFASGGNSWNDLVWKPHRRMILAKVKKGQRIYLYGNLGRSEARHLIHSFYIQGETWVPGFAVAA